LGVQALAGLIGHLKADDPNKIDALDVKPRFCRRSSLKTVCAIVINYHQRRLTEQAVCSVLASIGVKVWVVLVDNESEGPWTESPYAAHPRVELIRNAENIGFGAACNQGLERALQRGTDFVFLLNNDAVVAADALARLAGAADSGGLAAPKIALPDGRIYAAGGIVELTRGRCRNRGIYEQDRGQYEQAEELEFASACALMLARRVLESGIRFYEPYFLYYEDADFCLQLARAGWRIRYLPQARVTHLESASTPGPDRRSRLIYYDARNRLLFLSRQGRPRQRLLGGLYLLTMTLVKTLRCALAGQWPEAGAGLAGLRDYLARRRGPMPSTRAKRRPGGPGG
jgi:GT2 family glycosyltransferase